MPEASRKLRPLNRDSEESPRDLSAAEGDPHLHARALRWELAWWLGHEQDEESRNLIVALERRRRAKARVERLKVDPRANGTAGQADLDREVALARTLLDRAVSFGLRRRLGYRLTYNDRFIYWELGTFGATMPPGGGIAVCPDCAYVFEPKAKQTAARCPICERHPPTPFENRGVDGVSYSRLNFGVDWRALVKPDGTFRGGAAFKGWERCHFGFCSECDQAFQSKRRDKLTCSGACREARRTRRASGDSADLSPSARVRRADRAKARALLGVYSPSSGTITPKPISHPPPCFGPRTS